VSSPERIRALVIGMFRAEVSGHHLSVCLVLQILKANDFKREKKREKITIYSSELRLKELWDAILPQNFI
jgi:hypothetical protein